MDNATSRKRSLDHISEKSGAPPIATGSDDLPALRGRRVTFDLGTGPPSRSRDEEKAACRARARAQVDEEARFRGYKSTIVRLCREILDVLTHSIDTFDMEIAY